MEYLVEHPSLAFSSLALTLSIFTFYWTTLRHKKSLHLIRIDNFSEFMTPSFALVNGGSQDILFTNIQCGFNNADGNGAEYPNQNIEVDGGNSFLLSAGKAFHCRVHYLEVFTPDFALEGEKADQHEPTIYMRDMKVDLEWVELSGKHHKKSVIISRYGFLEDGTMRMRSPLQKEHDLYKV